MTIVNINTASPDITLRLTAQGVIERASISETLAGYSVEDWVGRPWGDTVVKDSGGKITDMLHDAQQSGFSAFRQVTQIFSGGLEVPVEYTTVSLDQGRGIVAIGKNLQTVAELQSRLVAAQRTMEQEYWKLRHIETRYRMLFDASNEAVVLLKAANLQILEANPAAIRILGAAGAGQNFLKLMPESEHDAVRTMFGRVHENGNAPAMIVQLGESQDEQSQWLIKGTLMTSDRGPDLMVQITLAGTGPANAGDDGSGRLDGLVNRLPDGFVTVDRDGRIMRANSAFLEMAQVAAEGGAIGQNLGRWLGRPGADLVVLMTNVRDHRYVGMFPTSVRGEHGSERDVEISAVGDRDEAPESVAILLRDVGKRLTPIGQSKGDIAQAIGSLSDEVGKKTLPELIHDTVSTVERHYVEAALQMTDGNRTAAAELLGLSRQSLYLKMHRYGLGGMNNDRGDLVE